MLRLLVSLLALAAGVVTCAASSSPQLATSRDCAFYEQTYARAFIARMRSYASLEHQEAAATAFLLQSRLKTNHSQYGDVGLRVSPRSPFARAAPSDFVAFSLFACSASSADAAQCFAAEQGLVAAATEDSGPVVYVQEDKPYRELALLSSAASTSLQTGRMRRPAGDARPLARRAAKAPTLPEELGVQALWAQGFKGGGVKVGVFDTGLSSARFQHVRERINWTHERKNEDAAGHGTFVAGVISGADARCPGLAPDAELYVFRMFTTEQLSFTSWFLDAFNYALFQGVHVLNLSTGGPDFRDRPFVDKIQELAANGVIIVSAVGNSGPKYGTLTNPADQMEVIGVGGVTRGGDVADFSSRGMTTWELPFGAGRVKPDIVTLAEDIPGFEVARGCTLLSGTSVSAPIVTGAVALLASMVPPEHRWAVLNPASVKQLLIASADRLAARYEPADFVARNHIFEQGSGRLNVTRASELVRELWTAHQAAAADNRPAARSFTPTSYPASVDTTNCPYMWPLCSQPLYHSSLPLMVNLTILNPAAVAGVLDNAPQWLAEENGEHLSVSVASPETLWPYVGSVGVFVEVKPGAAAFRGVAKGTLSLSIRSGEHVDSVRVPVAVSIVPTPPAAKRILWDQFHNLPYPSAFVPRDKLENRHELLDAAGDHPHTNFHQLWNFLRADGFFVEILPFEYSCVALAQYGAVLLVDPEEEFFADEVAALQAAIKFDNVSLLVFADWYDDRVLDAMDLFDTSTLSHWRAVTGGANVPALNRLLRAFDIELGAGAFSSSRVSLLSNDSDSDSDASPAFPYWSGSHLTKFPVGGYLGRADGVDQSAMTLNQSDVALDGVPVLGLYQVPAKNGGRIAVFGDSSCLDASVHPAAAGFRHCFGMLRALLRFTNDGILPPAATRAATATATATATHLEAGALASASSPQLEYLDVEFTGGALTARGSPPTRQLAALALPTPTPPHEGRPELKKHSKVLAASDVRPQRQSFCHFYRRQECSVATRVTMTTLDAVVAPPTSADRKRS
ncbi:hypothetical protein PybrP1_006293 [[Pythium] brassicae (nom. inval.)]|nr:hypothetical protein PybrP1_006293 [[Pythium] brassicae (nom. inval.)]